MHVGFFSDTFLPTVDGVSMSTGVLGEVLEARGHRVFAFAPSCPPGRPSSPAARVTGVHRVPSIGFAGYRGYRLALPVDIRVCRTARRSGLEIIHSHTPFSLGLLGLQTARALRLPLVYTHHTDYPAYSRHYVPGPVAMKRRLAQRLVATFGNASSVVIAPSSATAADLRSYGVKTAISVVPSAVDPTFFASPISEEQGIRDLCKIPAAARIVLTVSRLGPEKEIDLLLRGFSMIRARRPDTWYIVVGEGPDRSRLSSLARSLRVEDRVIFLGRVDARADLARVYAVSDVYMHASRTETQGLTLAEAAAAGLPVVAIRDSAVTETVKNGDNGFVVEAGPEALAERVLGLLEDPGLAAVLGARGRRLATAFGPRLVSEQILRVYEAAISRAE